MAHPCRAGLVAAAGAVVLALLCGSGDAFVVAGAGGGMASGRRAHATASAFTQQHSSSRPPTSGRSTCTMALRSTLTKRLLLRGRNPRGVESSSWGGRLMDAEGGMRAGRGKMAGVLEDAIGEGAAAENDEGNAEGTEGRRKEQRGVKAARGRRRFARLTAFLRFAREAVECKAGQAGKGARARIAAWRRRVSVAMIGVAAAFIVMTASAGPAQALFGIPQRQESVPQRLTSMPESVYVQRENLQEFCGTPQSARLFDFKDLTVYEEELNGLDMFADNIAPCAGTRESMRLKYLTHADDYLQQEGGDRTTGAYGMARFGIVATVGLLAVGTVLGSFLWVCRAFLNMAREEEVFLYGEEISVDATEKEEELDDLDEDLDLDDEDMDDFGAPPSASLSDESGGGSSPPPTLPSDDGGERDAGGQSSADEGDDLLGM